LTLSAVVVIFQFCFQVAENALSAVLQSPQFLCGVGFTTPPQLLICAAHPKRFEQLGQHEVKNKLSKS